MKEALITYPVEGVKVTEEVAVRRFLENIPDLIRRARRARRDAPSYRVKVGVAGYAVNPYTGDEYSRARSNIKPDKVKETSCGEPRTAAAIERLDGGARLIGKVVVGPMDPETIGSINTGIITETLHPCWRCRVELPRMNSLYDDTLVLTGGGGIEGEETSTNVFQIHTLGQIKNLYREPDNVIENQDTPLVNVPFAIVPAVYDNLLRTCDDPDRSPALIAIKALHLVSS